MCVEKRFSKEAKQAFQDIKNITKYKDEEKRDGGMVIKIEHNGLILYGDEMENKIIMHFKEIHNMIQGPAKTNFPKLDISDTAIWKMSRNVNLNKALGVDGCHADLFDIGRHKQCKYIK